MRLSYLNVVLTAFLGLEPSFHLIGLPAAITLRRMKLILVAFPFAHAQSSHIRRRPRRRVCVSACVRGVYSVARSPFPINALVPVSSRPQLTRNNRRLLRRHRSRFS